MPPDCDRLGYCGLVPLLCGGEGLSIQTLSLGLPPDDRSLAASRSWILSLAQPFRAAWAPPSPLD